jgi:hypothetical protein
MLAATYQLWRTIRPRTTFDLVINVCDYKSNDCYSPHKWYRLREINIGEKVCCYKSARFTYIQLLDGRGSRTCGLLAKTCHDVINPKP